MFFFLIPWVCYVAFIVYYIWITNAESQRLDLEIPVHRAMHTALMNRIIILCLMLVPVLLITVRWLARSTNTAIIRRIANWRRWKWSLAHPHGVILLGLAIVSLVPALYPLVDKDWIIPSIIIWYLLGTGAQVLFTGEDPEPEATTQ